ncbi:hypothetical protein A4R27_02260 [Priestia endophytica]|nr:hypothetical protein A4R27_02260 [Priestia endophytica]
MVSAGIANALTVLAVADRGNIFNALVIRNLSHVDKGENKDTEDVPVAILDWKRYQRVIEEIRKLVRGLKLF